MMSVTRSILSDIRICFTHHHYEYLIKQKVLLSSHFDNIYLKFFIIQFLPRKSGGLSEM